MLVRYIVLAASVITVSLAASTGAMARPDSTRMSCVGARDVVTRSGAIVMSTGGHTFDRFVRHSGYCSLVEVTMPAFVPSGDNRQCFVGYTCEPREGIDRGDN